MEIKQPSCVFLTTPTSATESLWRLLFQVTWGRLLSRNEGQTTPPMNSLSNDALRDWKPNSEGEIYIYRRSFVPNEHLANPNLRLVVNVRDTRDMACNQYFWHLQHPVVGQSEEEVEAHRKRIADQGIDNFVLNWDDKQFLRAHRIVQQRLDGKDPNVLLVSYNQLCLGFDNLVDDMCRFFNVDRASLKKDIIEQERVENLDANPLWIGNQWFGSDTAPGRFRRDLSPEIAAKLTEKHRESLEFLKSLEKPEFAHLYDL